MKRFILNTLLISTSLFFSCSQNKTPTSKKNTLHININHEPPTMDPRKGGDGVSSTMHFLLFDGLTHLNPDSSTSPAVAEKIDLSEDRKTYTFHLRDSYWSNGDLVTAYDFEESWKDILDPKFPSLNAHLLYPIKNAEAAKKGLVPLSEVAINAKDEKTLVVELEHPTPYFLQLTSFCVFYPVHKKNDREHPQWMFDADKHFIGNGPFLLKKWKHHDLVYIVKNPNYWDANSVKLDAIEMVMINDETTGLHMYEKGLLDMLGAPMSHLPVDALKELRERKILRTQPAGGTIFCTFNTQKFPFNNANVRKAFSYAINRKSIVDNITQLGEIVATSAVPPLLKQNKVTAFFLDHDIDQARELLNKGLSELNASIDDLNDIIYTYTATETNRSIAQAIQQQWQEAFGVQIKLDNVDSKVLLDRLGKKNYLVAQTNYVAQYNDQMNILERFKFRDNVKNYPAWENSEYQGLLERSAYDLTMEEREKTLEQAETLFLNEMPLAPIFHINYAFLIQPHLKGVEYTPIGNIYYNKIYLDKERRTL
jgi:oligopeptide transport system substrate-binding protein